MRTILLNCYQITGYVLAGLLIILCESGELTAHTKLIIDTKQGSGVLPYLPLPEIKKRKKKEEEKENNNVINQGENQNAQ